MKRSFSQLHRGLTLIELVVVLAILVGLAALIVPRLDFLKNQADHAAAAATSGDLATMLQTQKTATGTYPSLDLLTDESGAVYSKLWSDIGPLFTAFTFPEYTGAPGTEYYRSFLEGGLKTGYQQVSTATDASNSTGTAPAIDLVNGAAGGDLVMAELADTSTHPYVTAIRKACFPETNGATPAGVPVKLVAMGIGPRNTMVGNVMTSTPTETQGDNSKEVYCRYMAVFAVYGTGRPAQLKMVVDHRGKQVDKRIAQFAEAGPST
jgi:prepilin-type N-terminal cleavage/methylation domain-containing protein